MTESELKYLFLRQRQSLPITIKIEMAKRRITHWYDMWQGNVHVTFSGGKDSTLLLHLVRMLYPHVPAVFVDTGLEFPEIKEFVRTINNVVWLKPKMSFKQVCETYGYPVVSKETSQKLHEVRHTKSQFMNDLRINGVDGRKRQQIPQKWKFLIDAPFKVSHKCCDILKKRPLFKYEKETGSKAITGIMASESSLRTQKLAQKGCFIYGDHPTCNPLSFFTEEDVLRCLKYLPHSKIYEMGYSRTGCMFCMFGVHLNKPNKFQIMKATHPRLWEKGIPAFGIDKIMDFIGVPYGA